MKIPCESGLEGHWGLELVPRGSQRGIRGVGWSKNLPKKANNAGHNGPRRPPEEQSGESWDHFEVQEAAKGLRDQFWGDLGPIWKSFLRYLWYLGDPKKRIPG